MTEYVSKKRVDALPRLPLEGSIDLTYRCNNNCRHCWLWIPPNSPQAKNELSFDEIKRIVDEAKEMGCRKWSISGGEPMLRPDFEDIFDYITRNSTLYTLNTNGTLISSSIARLMKRKGSKLIALYGATADVHDHITKTPGSFESFMRGISFLKKADVGFTVQIVPMKDNFHQYQDMIRLAESLGPDWRLGASWLYLSAYGDKKKNEEIKKQRLGPREYLEIEKPIFSLDEQITDDKNSECHQRESAEGLFSDCIQKRRDYHIDPYGQISFCCYVKDPNLRFNLRKGSIAQFWYNFLPSLSDQTKAEEEYYKNCGSCSYRKDCRWCSVYGFLEHKSHSSKVKYLCDLTREKIKHQKNPAFAYRKFYSIAGLSIELNSDLPIEESTLQPKFKLFETEGPGRDNIKLTHHFYLPDLSGQDLGKEIYKKAPWAIYKKGHHWIYLGIYPEFFDKALHRIAVFSEDHSRGVIYHRNDWLFKTGSLRSLTLFPSDLILLSRLLADREGCCLHASGIIFKDKGLLFAGHSGAGKSTIIKLLMKSAKILCDDRMIIRSWKDVIKIHGTWSHGEIPDVSPDSYKLDAIFFIYQDEENRMEPVTDSKERISRLLSLVIRPLTTANWWDKTISFIEHISKEVPCYNLYFNKSGEIVEAIEKLCSQMKESR